jgi:hypothetical protein
MRTLQNNLLWVKGLHRVYLNIKKGETTDLDTAGWKQFNLPDFYL